MSKPRTLFEKIWDAHVVVENPAEPVVLYIDLHLIHEVTSPQAFAGLRRRGIKVRRPEKTVATMDHSTPTIAGAWKTLATDDPEAAAQLGTLQKNCADFGVQLYELGSEGQGIVHVMGPEMGATQPGMTIVCGDSHTATHGAFGALAFGIGTSEVEHVLATQCLLQRRPKTMKVEINGTLAPGVTAKDIILGLIAKIGVGGGTGHVIEYCGTAIEALSMEERMTVCNMSIEAGARAGLIAPDDTTFAYLKGRKAAPAGEEWDRAVERWRSLPSDPGASYDTVVNMDANTLRPMITWGTHPGLGVAIDAPVPASADYAESAEKVTIERALKYMDLAGGTPLLGQPIQTVFIGSCTNSRISDLRAAAGVMNGRKVADGVRMLVVPGSVTVKKQAEAEGLDAIFKAAGAEWREAGCSMCIAMNGDQLKPGEYAVSTSNRNFEGRQGKGGRTFLASPLTAAASAIEGRVADPRNYLAGA